MHDILKHRRHPWPEAVETVLSSAKGFGLVVVEGGVLGKGACELREVIAGLEIPASTVRDGASGIVRGLLWYAVDDLPRAHAIFQNESGFLGAYCHGMMHRREGDFWNANYWFRSAGKAPAGLFEHGFSPERLTAACERSVSSERATAVLEGLAIEAARIFDYVFELRVGRATQ